MADIFDRFFASLLPDGGHADLAARLRPLSNHLRCEAGNSGAIPNAAAHYVWLASGNAKLVAHGANGRGQVMEFHFTGDLVLVPAGQAHSYSLDAIDTCELLVFPAAGLNEAARSDAGLALALLERMTSALAGSREVAVNLGRKRAMERVAGFLLSIRDRVSAGSSNGAAIQLPMSRRDIGDNLAITVESISREVGRLRRERLIDTPARATVTILDTQRLATRAGFFAGAA